MFWNVLPATKNTKITRTSDQSNVIKLQEKNTKTTVESIKGTPLDISTISQKTWDDNPWARGVIKYYITHQRDIRQWKDEQDEIEKAEN